MHLMSRAVSAACAVFALGMCAHVGADPRDGGIWKAAVPSKPMKAEFDGLDPLGLAAGAEIKADCSLNWIDPDSGARYCFSSGTSLEFFLEHPKASIESAQRAWRKLRTASASRSE